LVIDEHRVETDFGGKCSGSHAGGAGADHRELGRRHATGSICCARICRRIFILGRTANMQLCRFGTPSI
jgi:hypothetical protein